MQWGFTCGLKFKEIAGSNEELRFLALVDRLLQRSKRLNEGEISE